MRLTSPCMFRVVRMRPSSDRRNNDSGVRQQIADSEGGQVLLIGLLVLMGLTMISISVANIGMMVSEKIHLQNTVDAAAYSSAVVEARYMNLAAYINRAMIANYDTMAFDTGVWATVDAYDHGLAVIAHVLYIIAELLFDSAILSALSAPVEAGAVAIDAVHKVFHAANSMLNGWFAQDDSASDFNQYIEMVNVDFLTMYEGLLYAATQSIRSEVQMEVAKKMDPEVLTTSAYGLGAEAVSYDELAKAVDWVIRDTDARDQPAKKLNQVFDKMHGTAADTTDQELFLSATTEASLEKFSAGFDRTGDPDQLRQFSPLGNMMPGASIIEGVIKGLCIAGCAGVCAATLGIGCKSCMDECHPEVSLRVGSSVRQGQENDGDEDRVPIIGRKRMREVNLFGIKFEVKKGGPIGWMFQKFLGDYGHTSGDKYNDIREVANQYNFGDFSRMLKCMSAGCTLNEINLMAAESMEPVPIPTIPFLSIDDHWDGTNSDVAPSDTHRLPMGSGYADDFTYIADVAENGFEEGVPKYDWLIDIDNVGFPLYIYPEDGAEDRPAGTSGGDNNNKLTGPSIGVVGIKKSENVNGLKGLGIGNEYSMTAIARAQVYYLRNPNRPDEKPSLFNPHWVARLAPLDSDDTPPLLRKGLPFVTSTGLPIAPTH